MGKCHSRNVNLNERNIPNINLENEDDKSLNNINPDDVPNVIRKNRKTKARVTKVCDGDTIEVLFYVGDECAKLKIRFSGIDTPESRKYKNRTQLEIDAGLKCKEYVKSLLSDDGNDKMVYIVIEKWGKWGGRVIANVYLDEDLKRNISEILLNKKYAVEYDGGKKHVWTIDELKYILNN